MSAADFISIHTDGASRGNPGPSAFAYIIVQPGEDPIEEAGKLGRMTNNQAEYTALVEALKHALELGADHQVIVHSDSELMVKQMQGEYRVKNGDLRDLFEEAQELSEQFKGGVKFRHVRREENRRADQLGNDALDGLREPTPRASTVHPSAALPRKSGAVRTTAVAAPSLRDEGVACLRQAADAWKTGAAEPRPEQVWRQVLALLKRHGLSSLPGAR